ncbi:hypothetical protein [Micromonospora carbonacea]|uniref:Uncharacterized protein n=1 Tax=Micromonospora carbonacea TaxID=47853 RepID=A0A1C5A9Y5_9ACTN|nr:hypothetical protein [Micromonospora carbonacea]SCF42015.1 hypothetical protein GA0070563_11227 [Micromonospora carbonacea]
MTDQTTTRLKLRRHGASVTHYADVPAALVQDATVLGRACRTVTLPVAALCGVVLGCVGPAPVVVMSGERAPVGCRACVKIAAATPVAAERG